MLLGPLATFQQPGDNSASSPFVVRIGEIRSGRRLAGWHRLQFFAIVNLPLLLVASS